MADNDFMLRIIAELDKQLSKRTLNNDLRTIDNTLYVKVLARISKTLATRELKKQLKELNNLYVNVGANVKIDKNTKSQLQQNIRTLQKSISDLEIGLKVSKQEQNKINSYIQAIRNKAQKEANREPISLNIEFKKNKLISDIEYTGKRYSKLFSNVSATQKYEKLMNNALNVSNKWQLADARAELAAFTSELKANGLAVRSTGDKWRALIDRSKDLFSAAALVRIVFSQLRESVSTFLQLDTAMTNLYKVQEQITSRDQFSGLLTKWNKLAQELSVTTQSLINSSAEWSKIGFDLDMSEQLAQITAIFEKTAEISNTKANSTLVSAAQAFTEIDDLGEEDYIERVEAIGNKINAVGNKYAISSEGISDALQNSSAALRMANNDLDESIAMITAGNKIFQSPDEMGNTLKVVSARLRGQKGELEALNEDTEGMIEGVSKVQTQILNLTKNKVNIFESDNETLKSTYEILLEIGKTFNSLTDRDQASLLEIIFGKQRMSAGASLLLNYEELEKVKNDSIHAANSMAEEYSKYMESAEAHIVSFKEKLVETYSTFLSGDMIKFAADTGSAFLDLVNYTDLLKHSLLAIASINIGKGISTIGATIASTAKQMNTLGSALEQVKNLPLDDVLRENALKKIGDSTQNLTEKNLKLLLSQKQLIESDRLIILGKHNLTEEEARAKLEKMQLTSATNKQSAANLKEATTTATLKGTMTSLKASIVGVGASIRASLLANPLGWAFTIISTGVSIASTAISNYNQKLEETRRANMDAATSAKEKADSLRDLYVQYENLNSITNRTSSQEEQFKQVVIDITKALGDKAEALEGLTAGTDDYTKSLKEATKAELEGQYSTAKIGAKAAEEELKSAAYSKWYGSKITIRQNEKMTGVEEHIEALNAVKDILREYENLGIVNGTPMMKWEPINWDFNQDDIGAVVEYYQTLVRAREKLATADNADFLMSSDIYEDINTTINDLTESVEKYTEQQYNALKLNYEWQNGVPSTEEEFRKMEESILNASGAGKEFQEILKGYLAEDFSTFSESVTKNIGDLSGAVENATQLSSDIKSFSEAWNAEDFSKAKDELLALAEAGRLTPETLQSTEEYKKLLEQTGMSAEEAAKKINSMTDASTQLQSMSAQISKMSDMLADKKNKVTASADDLASFDVEVRGLESWKEFERLMGDSNSTLEECQKAANDLATEWVNNSNFLANLTEETKQSYITQLEKMGVENAEQVVLTALGASTEYATLAIAHNSDEKNRNIQVSTDLSNATADEIIQLINEGNASDETANSLYHYALEKSNASNLTLATASDCSNLYNLVSALGVASSALKNYAYAKRVLESAQKWDDSPLKDAAIANAENTLKSLEASATKDIKTVFDKTNNVKISPKGSSGYKAPSTGKSKSGSGSSKSDTKQTVDWISRLLDVLQKKIDATKAKFDNLFTLKSKNNNLNTQINQTKVLLTATNKAADKYKKQADKVGLSKSLKKKVQSGDYNINNYSSETADKISKYQDYYNKYKELKQKADELTTDIRNLRTERYQLYVDDAEAKIAKSQVYAELDAGNYKEQNKHLEYQKKQLKTQYDYLIKIAELNKDSVEVAKLKAEYQKELNNLTMQEFDNIANTYDNKVGLTNNKIKAFQDQISLLEAKGQKIGSALYTKQMSLNNINEKKLVVEREKLIEKLNEIPKGTDDWYKAQDTLFSVESELVNVQIENANLQKSINQLKFDRFDDLLNKLNDIVDETDFLIDMLDSENFFDDNGKITDDGITAMGMYAQKRDIYKAESEKYKQMQAELDQMYANGDIGIIDYEAKMREYKSGQMDMAKAAEDMNKSIINLVSDGLEKQNQALSESIQKQKDLLRAEKDLKSFQDSLNDANKNVSRLERQYEVLSGDDSEENRKRLREIKSQLEDAKKSRDDLLYDKSIEDQEKNLDDMYDAAVKSSEEYLKDSAKVLIDACGLVNANTETVSKNIERISKETGVEINDNITKAWQNSGNAVSSFGDTITTKTPGIISQIKLIADEMDKLAEKSEKAAQAIVDATTDDYLEHTTIGANGNNNGNGSSSETKTSLSDIKNFITKNAKEAKNDKSYYAPLNQYIYDKTKGKVLSKENERKLAKLLNVDIKTDLTGDKGREELAKIRDALKLAGFSKGGVISELSDAIRLNGDTVLISAKPGERMLTEQQNGYWEKWTQSLPNLMNLTDIIKPNVNIPTAIPTVNREQSPVYNIDSSITVDGVATNEIVKDMANVAKKQAENVISEINRRTYAKGVRWK